MRPKYNPRTKENKKAVKQCKDYVKQLSNNRLNSYNAALNYLVNLGYQKHKELEKQKQKFEETQKEAINWS